MNKKELGLFALILILDIATKTIVENALRLGQSVEIIKNFFYITFATNTGAAWSMLEGKMVFFYIVTTVACIGIIVMLVRTDKRAVYSRISLVMILAGALGNFIDRLFYQQVRDFLDFTIFGYDFPIFNVADISLCLGVCLMILIVLLGKEEF